MNNDKKILYISLYAVFILLLLALFIPTDYTAWICALLMALSAVFSCMLIKKRAIHSFTKGQVTVLLWAMGFMYIVIFYISGFFFGFEYSLHRLTASSLFIRVIPIALTIISSEIFRSVMIAQSSKQTLAVSYLICVISEILLASNIPNISSFYIFIDVIAQTLLPAIIANLLYTYLSKRYGALPNIGYRLLVTLFPHIIPIVSGMPDAVYALCKLFVPILIYFFIDAIYEKKKKNALRKKDFVGYTASVLGMALSIIYVMLISCQFTFGLIVIATPSMTNDISPGDAVLYKEYENDRKIEIGQILVFEKNNSTIVHRVVDIEIINGQTRYITKGDANEDNDPGYITDSNITGVVEFKIPLIGQPTLWMRDLFKK